MKSTRRTILKTTLATSLAVVATGSAGAMASWTFVGSDTLTEVVKGSITGCEGDGTCTAGLLIYNNTGSGAAETGVATANPTQRIAPMSRNFTSSVLSSFPTLAPAQKNIVGLDAAVMAEKNVDASIIPCPDLTIALDPDQATNPNHAAVNEMIGLLLGGKDGKGDTASCSDPARLAAIDTLSTCFGGAKIQHLYRRDDRSGTADTFKEKMRIQRFCNGRAPGLVGGLDNNMADDDSDPIRRPCVAADANHAQTVCTNYPATTVCTTGATCTQGLLISLSQNDPGASDITLSIARRTRLDTSGNNVVVGFAGRAAGLDSNNTMPTVNTIGADDFNTRADAYMLARRLYVNWGIAHIGAGKTGGPTADDTAREAAELKLFNWMTAPGVGRFNVDPVLANVGFLPCTEDSSAPSGPGNLCSKQVPPPAAETTPKQCIPPGATSSTSIICCASGLVGDGTTACGAFPCAHAGFACAGTGVGNCCAADATHCTNAGGYSTCQ